MEEKAKKSIKDEIQLELEEMEKKLKQGGEEFKAQYKENRARIAKLIRRYAEEIETSGEEKFQELKDSSEELLDLLEADFDLSYTDYENESHKISKAIDRYEALLKKWIAEMSDKASSAKDVMEKDINDSLEKLKTELDIQSAHFKGTKERAMAEFEEWKANRLKDIEVFKKDLEQKKSEAGEKIDDFNAEINQSFDHLKKAFKSLW